MKINNFFNIIMFFAYNVSIASDTTTIMAPLDGNPFIEMVDTPEGAYIILGSRVILGDGKNSIMITENNNPLYPIIFPQDGTSAYLGINKYGQIITLTSSLGINSIGIPSGNYINCDPDLPYIVITTEQIPHNDLKILSSSTGNIILKSSQIITPPVNQSTYLGIDENNCIITLEGGISPDVFNNLTATGQVSLGTYQNNQGANIFIPSSQSANSEITFSAASGFIFLGNFPLPGINETAVLTINSDGKIGILLSSKKYKKNIKKLVIEEEDFDKLLPVQYNYLNNESKLEFGLIAEDVKQLDFLCDALVVLDEKGDPLTINYHAVLIVILEQFLMFKKKINRKITEQDEKIKKIENKIGEILERLKV